jgi:hypothetical protein
MTFLLDNTAREIALTRWGLPECLHIPTAAVDEAAITTYIGEVERVLADGSPRKALLVRTKDPPSIDMRFPIWDCWPPGAPRAAASLGAYRIYAISPHIQQEGVSRRTD